MKTQLQSIQEQVGTPHWAPSLIHFILIWFMRTLAKSIHQICDIIIWRYWGLNSGPQAC
jgi:hypothetical protein